MKRNLCLFNSLILILFTLSPISLLADEMDLSKGQSIYIPAYSHIYTGSRERPFNLTVTLSIRNIDPEQQIEITTVDYFETKGQLVKKFLEQPKTLQPLESIRYVIPERGVGGGSGANFIVNWKSSILVNPPIVESIMVGTQSQQGVSFISRGRVIKLTK